jgi:hypothetical protein
MGEVYRARDTRLNRDVALKVLPEGFGSDADRVMRFTREAQTLAALNHPHIAHVYDAGRDDTSRQAFIAMELVDGEDLSRHLTRGALSVREALSIARQLADALAAAHDAGIVHRDLKPANIKIRDDGVVKVLDFGLAKALGGNGPSATPDAEDSPTMTSPAMTAMGLVLGTAAYMAPEQARGKSIDRRADVWAFGVVLYEMLTGVRLFGRDDVTDTLAAVLTVEPDLSKLPHDTPAAARRLVERCLVKDKRARLDSMTVARIEVDEAMAAKEQLAFDAIGSARSRRVAAFVGLVIAGAAIGMLGARLYVARSATPAVDHGRLIAQIGAPLDAISAFHDGFALSPDGSTLVFAARNRSGLERIWIRRLDQNDAHEIAGTDGGVYPFWAPDSRTVAFFASSALKRVDVDGGQLQTICEAPGLFQRGSWSAKNEIVWSSTLGEPRVHEVAAAGGASTTLEALGAAVSPSWLPKGERFVYGSLTMSDHGEARLASADGRRSEAVGVRLDNASYGGGFLFFNRNDTLTAQRLDEASGTLVGQAVPIAPVAGTPKNWFAVSSNGDRVVAMVSQSPDDPGSGTNPLSHLVWVDRQGNVVGTLGNTGRYWTLRLSPDGKSAIVNVTNDVMWLRPDMPASPVTTDGTAGLNVPAVWRTDGSEIIYAHGSDVMRKTMDPQARPSLVERASGEPQDWSNDGRWLMLMGFTASSSLPNLFVYDVTTRTQRLWHTSAFAESDARFSPDGKWVAYVSSVSGRAEIYLRPFEGEGQPIAVSTGGGEHPFWRQDGGELFYLGPADELMSASLTQTGASVVPGKPKQLFRIPLNDITRDLFSPYAAAPNGQRFLLNVSDRPDPLLFIQGLGAIVK